MIKIYGTENSRAMRPIWTAEEMGLDYKLIMMPFPPRVFMKEYLDVNMLGTIPYLIDGNVKMTESVAMSQYLVEKYGPTDLRVMPNEPDYPDYLNWLFHSDATLTFPQTVVLRYKLQEPGVADAAVDGYSRWFVSRCKLLEKTLNEPRGKNEPTPSPDLSNDSDIQLAKKALAKDPKYVNYDYRKEQLWGEKLQTSTEILLQNEQLKKDVILAKSKIIESS